MKFVKCGELANIDEFFMFPKFLINMKELTNDAKIAYMFIYDRMKLSEKNKWSDENGHLFCYFTNEQLIEKLNVSDRTVRRVMKQLVESGLIGTKKQGFGQPNRLYLVELSNLPLRGVNLTGMADQADPSEVNLTGQERSELPSSNTNNTNTKKEETLELRSKEARPPHPSKTKKLFDTKDLEHTSRVKYLEDKLEALNKNKYPSKAAAIKIELAELTGKYDNITGRDLAYYYKTLYTDHYGKPLEDFTVYFAGTMNNILKTYVKSPELMFRVLERMLVQYEYRKEKDKYPTLNCDTLEKAWLMKKFIPNVLADLEREERNGGKQTEDKYAAIIAEKVKHMDQNVEYF